MPNAAECFVYHDEGLDSYDCIWEYPDAGSLTTARNAMEASVHSCLPASPIRHQASGAIFSVIKSNGYSVEVRLNAHESQSGRYRLKLSVERKSDD